MTSMGEALVLACGMEFANAAYEELDHVNDPAWRAETVLLRQRCGGPS